MKVYVITKGEYSDYHICCVTDDQERAESLRRICSDVYDAAEIEEFDTEEIPAETTVRRFFAFRFDVIGNIIDEEQSWTGSADDREKYELLERIGGGGVFFFARVFAENRDLALKIARDRRAKMIAEKYGL